MLFHIGCGVYVLQTAYILCGKSEHCWGLHSSQDDKTEMERERQGQTPPPLKSCLHQHNFACSQTIQLKHKLTYTQRHTNTHTQRHTKTLKFPKSSTSGKHNRQSKQSVQPEKVVYFHPHTHKRHTHVHMHARRHKVEDKRLCRGIVHVDLFSSFPAQLTIQKAWLWTAEAPLSSKYSSQRKCSGLGCPWTQAKHIIWLKQEPYNTCFFGCGAV